MKGNTYAFTVNALRVFIITFAAQMAAVQNVYTQQAIIAAVTAAVLAVLSLTPSSQAS